MRLTRFDRLLARLRHLRQRHHSRRQLRCLDPHLLEDIGISRADALREADKPFWKA